MSNKSHHIDHLDTIYTEGSEWIRMCNHIIWAMGTLLVPVSIGSMGWALQHPSHKPFAAAGSIFIFAFWVYVSRLYRASAASTRQVLMAIEREWELKDDLALYHTHGQVGLSRYGLFSTQVFCLIVLIVVWVLVLFLPS